MNKLLLLSLAGAGVVLRADESQVNEGLGNLLLAGSLFGLVKSINEDDRNVQG